MIHTIVSLNEVFAQNTDIQVTTEKTSCGYAEYVTSEGKKQLRRLISTDPAEYLKL